MSQWDRREQGRSIAFLFIMAGMLFLLFLSVELIHTAYFIVLFIAALLYPVFGILVAERMCPFLWKKQNTSTNRIFEEHQQKELARLARDRTEFNDFLETLRSSADRRDFEQFKQEKHT